MKGYGKIVSDMFIFKFYSGHCGFGVHDGMEMNKAASWRQGDVSVFEM